VLRDAASSPEEVFPAARRQPNPTPDPRQSITIVHAKALLALCQLVAILVVASDKTLVQGQSSSRLGWTVVAITTVAMFAVSAAMFVVTTRISYDRLLNLPMRRRTLAVLWEKRLGETCLQ
jgi:hypothetical protein